jgi:hypothetical protein
MAMLLVLAVPARGEAWGFEAHKFIMGRAIAVLPTPIRAFFEASRVAIVEHAIDPDLWRIAGWEQESPRHFLDMDAYGSPPFNELPRDLDEATRKFGREVIDKNGTLPWRTAETYAKLVEAFRQQEPYSRENIRFFSSVIAHYVSDAHVPFHAALNHDGQVTGQWGIHRRFEAELFERYRTRLRIMPRPLTRVPNARDFVFDALTGSFSFVQTVLDGDKAAAAGRDVFDDGYYAMFFGKVRPVLERRLSDSITAVASVIAAAWVEAGRPPLPLKVPRVVAPIRRR